MSLARDMSAMSDARRTALRRNYETTKLERDAMAAAYAKNGAQLAGNINLQQFDWKLERLTQELREAGEIVETPKPVATQVPMTAGTNPAELISPEVIEPVARTVPADHRIRDAVSSMFHRGKR